MSSGPWHEMDVQYGDDRRMAQVFPRGTGADHWEKLCWCRPAFQFHRQEGAILGAVVHR